MEHNDIDKLGVVIKTSRKSRGLTREQLAESIHITPRYLMSIENENQKPSYDVLFRLIRALGISADDIFFPECKSKNKQEEQLMRLIYECDDRNIKLITAMVKVLLESKR
jgi:transcriptional regulator with XRE-family HTH domain